MTTTAKLTKAQKFALEILNNEWTPAGQCYRGWEHTDAQGRKRVSRPTLGTLDALVRLGLVEHREGAYGEYVTWHEYRLAQA